MQCFSSSAVFAALPYLICFVRPFVVNNRLSLAASGCEKEKKKGRKRA
jgi:hypothetical protein